MPDRLGRNRSHRRFLFLQGLSTPLFFKLGRALRKDGYGVLRINICAGDRLFWPDGSGEGFRGRFTDWAHFLTRYLYENGVTDIVLFGDRRPYHRVAIALAARRGITVHVFDEGYLRPHWLTMESGGAMHLGLEPDQLRKEAETLPSLGNHQRVGGGFARRATWDVAFHAMNLALRPFYPFYIRHRPQHPLVEGLSWVRRASKRWRVRRSATRVQESLVATSARYFLLPLQLDSDFQIRHRSPYKDMGAVMGHVFASFAAHAPQGVQLVVKVHPLDNGLVDRPRQVAELSRAHGLEGRVHLIDGGHLPTLIGRSDGVVVVNSTTGLAAMHQRKPVFALANPIYKLAGLVSPGTLESFWNAPQPPKPELVLAFERVLAHRCQVNGSYFTDAGMNLAVRNIMLRLVGIQYANETVLLPGTAPSRPALL